MAIILLWDAYSLKYSLFDLQRIEKVQKNYQLYPLLKEYWEHRKLPIFFYLTIFITWWRICLTWDFKRLNIPVFILLWLLLNNIKLILLILKTSIFSNQQFFNFGHCQSLRFSWSFISIFNEIKRYNFVGYTQTEL